MDEQAMAQLAAALADVGCSSELIAEIVNCADSGTRRNKLLRYRETLLKKLHAFQKQLDILDYIIRFLDGGENAV